ncbi:MAG TPA: hypothetical protein VEK08_07865 [Planctomycetota bacterium]|nr:hypothetical protein [Planctomycetota bacterium]
MRYILSAQVIPGKAAALQRALRDGSFSRGFPYGDLGENVREGKVDADGTIRWVETCYCREYLNVAMVMELEYLERYLHRITVTDARDPRYCKGYPHCNDCLCTKTIRFDGRTFDSFLDELASRERPRESATKIPTQWAGWRGKVQTEDEKQRNQNCELAR